MNLYAAVTLKIGDQVTLRAKADAQGVRLFFLLPNLTDSAIANNPSLGIQPATNCMMPSGLSGFMQPPHADQQTCTIARSGVYHLILQTPYVANATDIAEVGVSVTHTPGTHILGTCSLTTTPPRISPRTVQFADTEQVCWDKPSNPGTDYIYESWRLHVTHPSTLTLTEKTADDNASIQVLLPNTDPTDYPNPVLNIWNVPGKREVCGTNIAGQRKRQTRCTFPSAGDYIVLFAVGLQGGDIASFTFH
jgi:hypothetical protein